MRIHAGAGRHFDLRSAQRHLPETVYDLIVAWARPVHGAGAVFLTLREVDLPRDLRSSALARQARGWIVVQSRDGIALTCYRRAHATAFLRRRKAGRSDQPRRIAA